MSVGDPLYPAAPPGVPPNLARPGLRYRLQVVLVLLALLLFVVVYWLLLAVPVGLLYWVMFPPEDWLTRATNNTVGLVFVILFRASVFVAALMFGGLLLKGLLYRPPVPAHVAVSESEQPELFRFLRAACAEIGSPFPARVWVNDDVNAFVISPVSFVYLIIPPPQTLLIGLGLVNVVTLQELKAVLAHEFGHFSQRSLRLSGYAVLAHGIVNNLVYGRDRWDDWVIRGFDAPWLSVIAVPLYLTAEWTRKLLVLVYRVFDAAFVRLLHQMEFNADLVAVSVAGSDALVHLLAKVEFGSAARQQAEFELRQAAEHGLFSADLIKHHDEAAAYLRLVRKDATLGHPSATGPAPVFSPEVPHPAAMLASHPSHYDREQNAKRHYVASPPDDRPAWLLFRDADRLRTEVARLFYEPIDAWEGETLTDPATVAAFIAEERAAVTYDPRYHGIYDGRDLEVNDVLSLSNATDARSPGALCAAIHALFGPELAEWAEGWRRRREEQRFLSNRAYGPDAARTEPFEFRGHNHPASEAAALLVGVESELAESRPKLAEFDRTAFSLHYALAGRFGKTAELLERYRFLLRLQELQRSLEAHQAEVHGFLNYLSAQSTIPWSQVGELAASMLTWRDRVAQSLRSAADLPLPPLTHVPAGTPLSAHLPPAPTFPDYDPAVPTFDGRDAVTFNVQLFAVLNRVDQLRRKSLGCILILHEWLVQQAETHAAPEPQAADRGP